MAALTNRGRAVLRYTGYCVLALVMFVYFFVVTFPFGEVKDRLIADLPKTLPCAVTVGDLRATPSLGIKASRVSLYPSSGKEARPQDATPLLTFRELVIRPSVLSLLMGRQAASLRGSLYGGEISGSVAKKGSSLSLAVKWNNLSLGKHEYVKEKKVEGTLSGKVDLDIQNGNPVESKGSLEIRLSEGSVGDALQVYAFPIPQLNGLTGTGKILVGNRKATIEEFSLQGKEINLSLSGDMDLSPLLTQTRMNVKGSLKLAGSFAAQYDPLLQGFLRNKNKDGSYPFSLRGTISQPRLDM